MNTIRNRAKEHMPMVLLTLLSIVQALALELLWSHIGERDDLYVWGFDASIGWLQVFASLTGLILIWLVYSTTVMRFSWVPSIPDSVWPFIIGILEFVLISSMGQDTFAQWFFVMALLFTIMTVGNHSVMRRARLDEDNAEFFASVKPAKLKDFLPHIAAVSGLILCGFYLGWTGNSGWGALLALLFALGVLSNQIFLSTRFWAQSIGDRPR